MLTWLLMLCLNMLFVVLLKYDLVVYVIVMGSNGDLLVVNPGQRSVLGLLVYKWSTVFDMSSRCYPNRLPVGST
ncbi:hypothetical protein CEXT_299611 [Caerostris extrusa]|uniref:Secreted protein n=1 Tax=Caerostris extrusa TaxID=172846 RepID=A0AAV4PU60_CAEEX|nr:hypothetical protein CEXT_299611 [Caerostris extrusa]